MDRHCSTRTRLVTCGRFDSHTSDGRHNRLHSRKGWLSELLTPPWESSTCTAVSSSFTLLQKPSHPSIHPSTRLLVAFPDMPCNRTLYPLLPRLSVSPFGGNSNFVANLAPTSLWIKHKSWQVEISQFWMGSTRGWDRRYPVVMSDPLQCNLSSRD